MSANSWLVRRLRSRVEPPSASRAARQLVTTAAVVRRRRPRSTESDAAASRLVVCGDDPLAFRLISELTTRYSADVTAVMPSRRHNQGPRIARLPGVRIVESHHLDVETFRHARLAQADAVALTNQDDVGNIHAALQAQEVNPNVRLVLRMFNMSLGHGVRRLLHDCVVLSDAAMAAPAFVSAALGEVAPVYVRLQGRTLFVARRSDVAPADVLCGLARTTDVSGRPDLFPRDQASADLVLATAAEGSTAWATPVNADGDRCPWVEEGSIWPTARVRSRPRRRFRRRDSPWRSTLGAVRSAVRLVSGKLLLALMTLLVLLSVGTIVLAHVRHLSWANGAYVVVLTTLGGAEPDLAVSRPEKVLQTLLTMVSIALIPVVTATVVDAVVQARLALTLGLPRRSISDHVVVVGLGNLGTRVIRQLHDLGVPVVAVDRSESAKGCQVARDLGMPVVIGDASRSETLHAAYVQTCRALVCLSTDDGTNIEAALYGHGLRDNLRVVLRLFDSDFANRAQAAFGITSSRSVSDLAAPRFAAAMVERRVIETIPVSRRVLLIAEVPVLPDSQFDGGTIADANEVGRVRVIAVTTGRPGQTLWSPPEALVLTAGDTLTVVATRGALARLLAETGDPLAHESLFPAGQQPSRHPLKGV